MICERCDVENDKVKGYSNVDDYEEISTKHFEDYI
jgi:hypothetical protein